MIHQVHVISVKRQKRMPRSHNWVWFYFWLDEKVAGVFKNRRKNEKKMKAYFMIYACREIFLCHSGMH